ASRGTSARLRSAPFVAKLARRDAQRDRQALQDIRRQIDQSALDFRHVGLIAVDKLRKLLLREAARGAQPAHVRSDDPPQGPRIRPVHPAMVDLNRVASYWL